MIRVVGYSFSKTLELYLLRLTLDRFQPVDRTIIWYGIYAARTVYAQHWCENRFPKLEDWVVKLTETMGMNSLAKYLRDS